LSRGAHALAAIRIAPEHDAWPPMAGVGEKLFPRRRAFDLPRVVSEF
jgi:hypothetical protein